MKLEKFIDSVNYRYENTLRINFNSPLGLGSYCDNLQDLKTECDYVYDDLSKTYDDVILSKFIDLFDNVNVPENLESFANNTESPLATLPCALDNVCQGVNGFCACVVV
jgi:hypothetical protein